MSGASETLTIRTPKTTYSSWTEFSVGRELTRCVSDFTITGSDADAMAASDLQPFTPVTLFLGADPVLTGFIDAYMPQIEKEQHTLRLTGRSKTEDLTDCTPDIDAGQFSGYSLAAIATSICNLFNLTAVSQTDLANAIMADATLERAETAWDFLDRLCAISGVLSCDDELGRLLLTTAGSTRSSGRLLQGNNVLDARASVSGHDRFSQYIVKGQSGVSSAIGAFAFDGDDNAAGTDPTEGEVQTQQRAVAYDKTVPRYRPKVIIAEGQLNQAQMQQRANWQMQYAFGQGTKAMVTVQGWRQPNGKLWQLNQLIPVMIPLFGIDEDLLILGVQFKLTAGSDGGRQTVLTVGPVEGATPKPSTLPRRKKGKGGSAVNWSGLEV